MFLYAVGASNFLCSVDEKKHQLNEKIQLIQTGFSSIFKSQRVGEYLVFIFGKISNLETLLNSASIFAPQAVSDVERLILLKKHYGIRLVPLLRGDFIAGWIHLESQEFQIILSPFSFKRLYYIQTSSGFFFSNSVLFLKKNLEKLENKIFEINPAKILDSLAKTYHLSGHSFYRQIDQLERGQMLSGFPYEPIKKTVYWTAQDRRIERPLEDHIEGLKEKLEEAVQNFLSEGDRVCCEISGGLDSTSVAGVLARRFPNLIGLSDCTQLDHPENKEAQLDPQRSNHGLLLDFEALYPQSKIMRYKGFKLAKNYSDLTRFCFEHVGSPGGHAPTNLLWIWAFYEFAAQNGFNKIFSGRSGDLAFSFRCEVTKPWIWGLMKPKLRNIRNFFLDQMGRSNQAVPLLKTELFNQLAPWEGKSAIANPNLVQRRLKGLDLLRRYPAAASGFDGAALNYFGVELCDPTGDLDLIEYCLSIPPELYQQKGINRYITREAIKGIVPESVRLNKIKGAQGAYWYIPLKRELPYYKSLMPKFAQNDLIAEVVDLERLNKLLLEFEHLRVSQLNDNHRFSLIHALHVCEWVVLHDGL